MFSGVPQKPRDSHCKPRSAQSAATTKRVELKILATQREIFAGMTKKSWASFGVFWAKSVKHIGHGRDETGSKRRYF